jgi:hypothetical protein
MNHYKEVLNTMVELKANGYKVKAIANKLNKEGFKTLKGKAWTGQYVGLLLRAYNGKNKPTSNPSTPSRSDLSWSFAETILNSSLLSDKQARKQLQAYLASV